MKISLKTCFLLVMASFFLPSASNALDDGKTLYEQLCKVNQEWYKNSLIAQKSNFTNQNIFQNEQDILQFHLLILENEFRLRNTTHLTPTQHAQRLKNLDILHEYALQRNCPKNYDHKSRIPVFIDEQNRYCAVAYLMSKTGKKEFTETVRKTSNNIYVREINNKEFLDWANESGLSIDELAWIQPGYIPDVRIGYLDKKDKKGNHIILDSTASTKIYNFYTDRVDYFQMNRIGFGESLQKIDKKLKRMKYSTSKPDFRMFAKTTKDGSPEWQILEIETYQSFVYASARHIEHTADGTPTDTPKLLCWKKGQWEEVLNLPAHQCIYALKNYKGVLYLGGGGYLPSNDSTYYGEKSYLAVFDGKSAKEIPTSFKRNIFGFIYKNKTMMVGLVRQYEFGGRNEENEQDLK